MAGKSSAKDCSLVHKGNFGRSIASDAAGCEHMGAFQNEVIDATEPTLN